MKEHMSVINTHSKSLDEILFLANEACDPPVVLIHYMRQQSYVKDYLELAVSEQWTTLDVDQVKVTQYCYPRSMVGAILLNSKTINIVNQVLMTPHVSQNVKSNQYKALMEMLFSGESAILKAILTKNLVDLYPSLTIDVITKALNEAV